MGKKWPIHVLSVLLCSIPVHAAETRASDRISRTTVTLSKASNGDLSVYFSVRATGVMEKIGASSVEIQRSTGSGWVPEYTFRTSNTPTLLQENKDHHSMVLTYSPLFSGKEYRAVVMIYAEDATGSSTKLLTSKVVAS